MIIECTNCNKKFEIDKNLIPDQGRLLQCGSCNHEWFFKKDFISEVDNLIKDENLKVVEISNDKIIKPIISNRNTDNDDQTEENPKKKKVEKCDKAKKSLCKASGGMQLGGSKIKKKKKTTD